MNVTGTQPQSNLVLGPLPPSSYQQPQGQQQQQQRGGSGNQNYPRQNYNKQRRERNTANMSNYETNPIGALQERFSPEVLPQPTGLYRLMVPAMLQPSLSR